MFPTGANMQCQCLHTTVTVVRQQAKGFSFVCLQSLSDAQQFLFEERQRLLALQAENDELKLQELEDRKRIQQLLSIAQPLEQDITFMAGAAPSATMRPGQQHGKQHRQHHGAAAAAHPSAAGAAAAAAGREGERVLRTVFLPTVNADFLMLKVESLEAQLNEQVSR